MTDNWEEVFDGHPVDALEVARSAQAAALHAVEIALRELDKLTDQLDLALDLQSTAEHERDEARHVARRLATDPTYVARVGALRFPWLNERLDTDPETTPIRDQS